VFDKLVRHTVAPAPDVRSTRPDVPAGLAELVRLMLAKFPPARPTAAAARRALGG
jgi:hypothetical protein